jgi:hypothetical protein
MAHLEEAIQQRSEVIDDVKTMTTEALVKKIMPSDRELEARSYTDGYSKFLLEVLAKDSFTNRKTTDAFRELQKRLPADHETMKLSPKLPC